MADGTRIYPLKREGPAGKKKVLRIDQLKNNNLMMAVTNIRSIKVALEGVTKAMKLTCLLLGYCSGPKDSEWKHVRKHLKNVGEFVTTILSFDPRSISAEQLAMVKPFFTDPKFTVERVTYENNDAGMFVEWCLEMIQRRVEEGIIKGNELKALAMSSPAFTKHL